MGWAPPYTKDHTIDATVTVHDGDVFLIPWLPRTLCGAPGHHLYYLNVMAGPGDERVWKACDDPAHAWFARRGMELSPTPGSR